MSKERKEGARDGIAVHKAKENSRKDFRCYETVTLKEKY